ncbi:nitrate- and nitrite sensing domain-containing protein [Micromonospora sp. HUAS LYJ1]|uniref:sensor histidine kinase n=1 Tax=Micromonospora sp. HUAS LYJ1 TaxID=3061626 RepID=UPI002671B5AC|nr:nitrate- and nitrite sensing domain-containing protein [Micromonospora sp. HUAS LYJ1]WKU07269.1 nitrate- and nitrite sensing domain-containing protein [Micromonospora sp. HUAS LYJ1]
MPVVRRLALLLVVPLVATVLFAAWGVASTGQRARAADRLQALVAVSAVSGEVVDELSRERLVAAQFLAGSSASVDPLLAQVARTDRVVADYRLRRGRFGAGDVEAGRLFAAFDGQLGQLSALRDQVRGRSVSLTTMLVRYRVAVSQGLAVREAVGQVGGADAQIAEQLRVAAALSRASEYAGVQQTAVLAGDGVVVTQAAQRELAAARAGYEESLLTVADGSSGRWRSWLDQALTGPGVLTAQRLDDVVSRARVGSRLRVDAADWVRATGERRDRLHGVQTRVDADIVAEVGRRRAAQWATTAVLTGAALALVVVAGVLTVWQGRALARRLRRVRDAVTRVASRDLPDLVRRVSATDPGDPSAMPAAPPALAPTGRGRDEIDEVTAAFDALALTVYETAADLARQRLVAAGAVEAVGRRCQGMAHLLMRELDRAERDEADEKTLATLFAVDNLAAQLLHATQSLLVLSGRALGSVRAEPVALVTVAQAALSRIREYRRVVVGSVDGRVSVPPALIDDLVHLLASLLDNATRYSPGETVISGHLLGDQVVVQVIDTGAGITPDLMARLNAELAAPAPMIAVEHIRRQGVATVAMLAAVHGLRVRLVAGQPQGTVAVVEIPVSAVLIAAPPPVVPALPARRPRGHSVDAPTQALPLIPAPRPPLDRQSTPVYEETTRQSPVSPWFVEGATVHLPPAGPTPYGGAATTVNGLPKRQPMGTPFAPPPVSAGPPGRRPDGLVGTARAYQRGLGHRSPQPKEGQ